MCQNEAFRSLQILVELCGFHVLLRSYERESFTIGWNRWKMNATLLHNFMPFILALVLCDLILVVPAVHGNGRCTVCGVQ